MPMSQADIQAFYEQQWKSQNAASGSSKDLVYSDPVEDAVLYPAYERLLSDLTIEPNGRRMLDVGSGAGRWVGFFLSRFAPAQFVGMDYTLASVELLQRWWADAGKSHAGSTQVDFVHASITDPSLDLKGQFDLINIANVLFHIPEHELFMNALKNLAKHLAPGGRIVTTEYLPRTSMRTEWMMVRSRYEFEAAAASVGLKIAGIRATTFFANDPLGLDGPDSHTRAAFNQVRGLARQLQTSAGSEQSRAYLVNLFATIEKACLEFARERVAEIDMPSQKLVVLAQA